MFHFFGRKDPSKKSAPEKELDGFVIVGELPEEERQRNQGANVVQPVTGVVVLPSKAPHEDLPQSAPLQQPPPASDAGPSHPELLSDVPFTLAPHILAMQVGLQQLPDVLFTRDFNDNLASFRYDFTLENSVLCDS